MDEVNNQLDELIKSTKDDELKILEIKASIRNNTKIGNLNRAKKILELAILLYPDYEFFKNPNVIDDLKRM